MTILVSVWLLVVWLLMWSDLSVGNIVGGAVVIGFLLLAFPAGRPRRVRVAVRPLAVLRLAGFVLRTLVTSNVVMLREVLSPKRRLVSSLVVVDFPGWSPGLLSVVVSIITWSPTTMTVDIWTDPSKRLVIHLLHPDDLASARSGVLDLRRLAMEAFGPAQSLAAIRSEGARAATSDPDVGEAP